MPSCGGKEKAEMQSQVWQTQVYVSQKEQKHKEKKGTVIGSRMF